MIDKFKDVAEYLSKIPLAFLIAILSFLGITLFSPEYVAEKLAIDGFRETFRVLLGPSFLLTFSFFIARLFTKLKTLIHEKKTLKERYSMLRDLTPAEKAYLAPYIFDQETTQYFGAEDGIKGSLEAKIIIYQASVMGHLITGFAYNLQPWAREYLTKHPELLEGAKKPEKRRW